jgi:hypothetical protein
VDQIVVESEFNVKYSEQASLLPSFKTYHAKVDNAVIGRMIGVKLEEILI